MSILQKIRETYSEPTHIIDEEGRELSDVDIALEKWLSKGYEFDALSVEFEEVTTELNQKCDRINGCVNIAKGKDADSALSLKQHTEARRDGATDQYLEEIRDLTLEIDKSRDEFFEIVKATSSQRALIIETIDRFKDGALISLNTGEPVADRKEALTIALLESEVEKADKVPGGVADGKTLDDICEKHGCRRDELEAEYEIGVQHEAEHTSDPEVAVEIAMDHLWEDHRYYHKLGVALKSEDDDLEKAEKKHCVAGVIRDPNDTRRILFLKRHHDDSFHPNTWCLPGGGIDEGEGPVEAILREVKEETNLEVTSCFPLLIKDLPDVMIHYFECDVYHKEQKDNPFSILALLDGESNNYAFFSKKEWEGQDLILQLGDHLKEMFEPKMDNVEIKKAIEELDSSDTNYLTNVEMLLEKGKKAAIGEERMHGGRKEKKTAQGWVPVGSGKKKGAKEQPEGKQKVSTDYSPEGLAGHAKEASASSLNAAVKDSKDERLRTAAQTELHRRKQEEHPEAKEKEKQTKKDQRNKEKDAAKRDEESKKTEVKHKAQTTRATNKAKQEGQEEGGRQRAIEISTELDDLYEMLAEMKGDKSPEVRKVMKEMRNMVKELRGEEKALDKKPEKKSAAKKKLYGEREEVAAEGIKEQLSRAKKALAKAPKDKKERIETDIINYEEKLKRLGARFRADKANE